MASALVACSSTGDDDGARKTMQPNQPKWRSVDVPECGFRVDLPFEPKREVENYRDGDVVIPTYMYMTPSPTGPGFMASCTVWPEGVLPDDVQYTLEGVIKRSLVTAEGLGGGIVDTTQRAIAHGDVPGVEFVHTVRNGGVMHNRAYRIGLTVIVLESILRPAEAGHRPATTRFFDSFALTGKQTLPPASD